MPAGEQTKPKTKQSRCAGNKDYKKILAEVTVRPAKQEVLMNPFVLETLIDAHSPEYLKSVSEDPRLEDEREKQLQQLRAIAQEKLQGRQRECVLLLLSGCESHTEIGKRLGVSRDTVRRALEEAAEQIKAYIERRQDRSFPSLRDQPLKTRLFSIDTANERQELQQFLNQHRLVNLALSTGLFREVLVVYQEGRETEHR